MLKLTFCTALTPPKWMERSLTSSSAMLILPSPNLAASVGTRPLGRKIMDSIRMAPKTTVSQPSNECQRLRQRGQQHGADHRAVDRGHAADHDHGHQFDRVEEVGEVGRDEADVVRGDAAHHAGEDGRQHEDRHLVADDIDADDLGGDLRAVQRAQRPAERRVDQVERGPDAEPTAARQRPSTSACRPRSRTRTGSSAAPACRPGRRSRRLRCAPRW